MVEARLNQRTKGQMGDNLIFGDGCLLVRDSTLWLAITVLICTAKFCKHYEYVFVIYSRTFANLEETAKKILFEEITSLKPAIFNNVRLDPKQIVLKSKYIKMIIRSNKNVPI